MYLLQKSENVENRKKTHVQKNQNWRNIEMDGEIEMGNDIGQPGEN